MAFQVPPSKKSKGQDRFEFEVDGKSFSVKKAKYLDVGQQETLDASTALGDRIDVIFGERGTPAGDAVRGLDTEQFDALMDAYNADSEVTPGESAGSSS